MFTLPVEPPATDGIIHLFYSLFVYLRTRRVFMLFFSVYLHQHQTREQFDTCYFGDGIVKINYCPLSRHINGYVYFKYC